MGRQILPQPALDRFPFQMWERLWENMPRLVLILVLFLSACATATPNVLLIHPASGDMVECSADDLGVGPTLASLHVDACVQNFTAVGFVETDKLTPEQKAAIAPSGKMLLRRRQFITQGSSSQGQQSQGLGFLCKDAIQRGDQGAIFVHC